jgi:transcriptional regulator with XRE-family HTH domain
METLSEFLLEELRTRNMTQAELARKSHVTPAQISRIISGQRGAESETLNSIADALDIPPEQIFRIAGKMSAAVNIDEKAQQIAHEVRDLPVQDKEEVLAFIRMKKNLRKKK